MGLCPICGSDVPVSSHLGACRECIVEGRPDSSVHRDLPSGKGQRCDQCVNRCSLAEGDAGYCGTRINHHGKVENRFQPRAVVSAYRDPLPTNCVADWVCPGGTGSGYPRYCHRPGPERGNDNLAVFYGACTFDCLFCQNWQYRRMVEKGGPLMTPEELASLAGENTSCVCFFGGDPTPFLQHSFRTVEELPDRRIMRVCYETNGSMSFPLAMRMGELSLETGGCVKLEVKAFNEELHRALCGTSNRNTLRNLEALSSLIQERRDPPPLVVSTLMVPGYVDRGEVGEIATFLAGLDPGIPYTLLAFHPDHLMRDLPTTSREQADRCLEAARRSGLERVKVANEWLLV